jgi:DNA-binding transcriptional LysR family regulator
MARNLNFTRAAEECNVTQPSLTRAIQKLEEEFEGPLFHRERSRTHLTELGQQILPHLERTFEAAEAAKLLAKGIGKAEIAPLKLGVAKTVDHNVLEDVLAEIAASLPGFELSVLSGSSEEIIELGMSGSLDLFIVEAPPNASDRLEAWKLFDHIYHMITSAEHPLANGEAVEIADISQEFWIEYCGDGVQALRDVAKTVGFEPIFRHRADSPADLRRMIVAGLGSAFIPPPRDRTRMAAIQLAGVDTSRSVVLAAISGRRRSVAAGAFLRASRARSWETDASISQ